MGPWCSFVQGMLGGFVLFESSASEQLAHVVWLRSSASGERVPAGRRSALIGEEGFSRRRDGSVRCLEDAAESESRMKAHVKHKMHGKLHVVIAHLWPISWQHAVQEDDANSSCPGQRVVVPTSGELWLGAPIVRDGVPTIEQHLRHIVPLV